MAARRDAGQRRRLLLPVRLQTLGLLSVILSLITGCANPGPVKSPSLRLPAIVTDLSAERAGDTVLLSWTTPNLTTDGAAITGSMVAEICRQVSGEATVAGLPDCRIVHRVTVSPGRTTLTDTLTPALEMDPAALVTYRIAVYSSKERTAGYSANAAYAAAGQAPPVVEGLHVANVEAGAELVWQPTAGKSEHDPGLASVQGLVQGLVQLDRLDLTVGAGSSAAPAAKPVRAARPGLAARTKTAKPPKTEALPANETLLRVDVSAERAAANSAAKEGALDTAVVPGHRYQYVVQRVRLVTVGGHRLEIRSEPSVPVVVERKDVFAPRRPTALEAVAGYEDSSFIDLSWEPNTELDLAGYLVERQTAGGAEVWTMLTSAPVVAPSFRDGSVVAGRRYRYRVMAVDTSSNRSAASDTVQETAAGAP